jgi:hypothetical protein
MLVTVRWKQHLPFSMRMMRGSMPIFGRVFDLYAKNILYCPLFVVRQQMWCYIYLF